MRWVSARFVSPRAARERGAVGEVDERSLFGRSDRSGELGGWDDAHGALARDAARSPLSALRSPRALRSHTKAVSVDL